MQPDVQEIVLKDFKTKKGKGKIHKKELQRIRWNIQGKSCLYHLLHFPTSLYVLLIVRFLSSNFPGTILTRCNIMAFTETVINCAGTHLLSYQLRIYAGFPRRSSLTDVTHEALKCFRCIPISADTTVPVIFFQNLRLTFAASRMVHCLLKSIVERCTFPKESLPSSEATASLNFAIFSIRLIIFRQSQITGTKALDKC